MIVCYIVAIAMILSYGVICHRENRKRKREASGGGVGVGAQDWLDLTDRENRGFRYTT
jgi:hypothetical protein